MIFSKRALITGAILIAAPLVQALSPADIPSDTPVSSLIASAKASLARGNANDALVYYDVAIKKDPQNYINIFQRGAAYLSLGRNGPAAEDFDRALEIKPDFEGALVQRAKLKSRKADWDGAKKDYLAAGRKGHDDYQSLLDAEAAAGLAAKAEKAKDWEACITHAGTAILVAGQSLKLREMRATCRFERGEVLEGVSDLQHILQLSPQVLDNHIKAASMLFYSVGDTEKGLVQIRKCLHSDPDSRPCGKLHRQLKKADKQLQKIQKLIGKKQYNSAVKILVGDGEDTGLLDDVKDDTKAAKESGQIHPNSPDFLYNHLVETACEFYVEMNNKKRAEMYCDQSLQNNPNHLHALILKARRQIDSAEYEAAIQTLNQAKEHHPGAEQLPPLFQKAHTLLKRSKSKDYYKVLEVSSDADDRTIKKAYRNMVKKYHPDKAVAQGLSKEEAEKKITAINEAYEVLGDPEKKAMFDRGDDPNSQEQQGNPFHGSPFGGAGGQQFFFKSGGGGGGPRFQFQGGFPGGGGFPFGGM